MNLSFFIGIRYLFSKRQEGFLSLISWFSFVGIILGVMALIIVLSVMNGFHAELRERILSVIPHVFVDFKSPSHSDWQQLQQRIEDNKLVAAAAPYIQGKAMLSVAGAAQGVQLTGIIPAVETNVSIIDKKMLVGSLSHLHAEQFGIVIGKVLAMQLQVGIGDQVKVVIPNVSITPAGIFPRMRQFTVIGIFEVGAQLDQDQAFIHIKDAQVLYRLRTPMQGLRVNLKQAFSVNQFVREVNLDSSKYTVNTWKQTNQSLFAAIKMEKSLVSFLLAVVVAVAAFNIISILSMMVTNKTSEIAVLRTMGASSKNMLSIFLIYGLSMALAGMLIGTLIALPVANSIGDIIEFFEKLLGLQIFDPSIYYISRMPSEVHLGDVVWVNMLTLILVFAASLYPAYRASKIEPAQALHYE